MKYPNKITRSTQFKHRDITSRLLDNQLSFNLPLGVHILAFCTTFDTPAEWVTHPWGNSGLPWRTFEKLLPSQLSKNYHRHFGSNFITYNDVIQRHL